MKQVMYSVIILTGFQKQPYETEWDRICWGMDIILLKMEENPPVQLHSSLNSKRTRIHKLYFIKAKLEEGS